MTPRSLPIGQVAAAAALALTLMGTAQAQRVVRDSATGQLRAPTADEAKALDAPAGTVRKAAQPVGLLSGRVNPQPVVHADGSVEQELDESTLMYSVARRNSDGTLSLYCVPGPEAAQRVVDGKVVTRAARSTKEHDHAEK